MGLFAVIVAVILACIIGGLWVTGFIRSRQPNPRAGNKQAERNKTTRVEP